MLNFKSKKIMSFPLKCQLEDDKLCDNCCFCYTCDLNPDKICDNCAQCLDLPDYNGIIIDDIVLLKDGRRAGKAKKK